MSDAQWYVVHTYSGYENKVKVDIEKTIENRGLQDQILEVSVPMEEVIELKNGAQKQVERKMFPGYVLIHMVMNDDTWYVVRNTRGVTGFVGPGSKPVPLSEEEMRGLGFKTPGVVVGLCGRRYGGGYLRSLEGYDRRAENGKRVKTVCYDQCRDVRPGDAG